MKTKISAVLFSLFAAVFAATPGSAAADETKNKHTAPFGLEWGMSKEKAEALGVVFTEEFLGKVHSRCEDGGAYTTCITDSLPKNLDNVDNYGLKFSPKYGLIGVFYQSEIFSRDQYGNLGKEGYRRLKQRLSKKYGTPRSSQWEDKDGSMRNYFYECLKKETCGSMISNWAIDDGAHIQLRMDTEGYDSGYLILIYDSSLYEKAQEEHAEDVL